MIESPVVRVEDLAFAYGRVEALRGISFEIQAGEVFGLLGPNGAGKSTAIKVLTGQLMPKAGKAQILGRDVQRDDPWVQAQIGVCFEEKNLYLDLSAKENLEFFASLFGIKEFDAMGLLTRVGLTERAGDRLKTFSKGMRQRVMISRAFVNRPRVLFLDEPTDGLDPASSAAIRAVIKEEAARGAAVLLTTHDMFEAEELSDRVAFINEGRIVALDTPENLKLRYGRREVRLRSRQGDEVRERVLALDDAATGETLKAAVDSEDWLTIHTEEATLESIFIRMTGHGLA